MKNKLEFNLLHNAVDSIDFAIELLSYEPDIEINTKYKRAILSISHGIELLLKERLRVIHPSLIWENIDKFPDLNGRTVGLDKAVHRLKRIGGLVFLEKDEQLLRKLKKTRNAIDHYTWSITEKEAEYVIGFSLSFAIFFANNYLGVDIIGYESKRDGTFTDLISNNPNFKRSYENRQLSEHTEDVKNMITCEVCKALIDKSTKDYVVCKKCGHSNECIESWLNDNLPF